MDDSSRQESHPDLPFHQRPAFWWATFALGTIVILAFVPYANAIQKQLRDLVGAQGLRWALIGVVAAAAAGVGVAIVRRRPAFEPARLSRTLFVPALAAVWMASLDVAAEAFHLVEYGLLGAVAYRALSFRLSGPAVYVAAAALTGSVGVVDEFVQWLVPGRFWGLHDVGLNVAGGVLAQVWIALARRRQPSSDSGRAATKSRISSRTRR